MNRAFLATSDNPVQSVFRIIVGFLFACHGAASLFGVLGGAQGTHGGTVPLGQWTLGRLFRGAQREESARPQLSTGVESVHA